MVSVAYLVPGTAVAGEERERRERVANGLVSANVSVVTADSGPPGIESVVEEAWAVPETLRKAHEIEDEYDAIVLGCFGDPGLRALRELVSVPVVGPAEATLHTAAQVADRFGWLTILDRTVPMCRELLDLHGLADRCAGVRSVDAAVEDIEGDADGLVDRMVAVGRAAVEEDGAEALFPGCMSLAFAQRHGDVTDELGVPFLDPLSLSLEQAGSWARHGVTQSERSYPAPDFDRLTDLL